MLIAESAAARRTYPNVGRAALEHLLWALHRVTPIMEDGDVDTGVRQLRTDLAAYRGPYEDFEHLGVRAIFTAAGHGRHALANQLGELRLLAPDPAAPRYVLVGDALAARLWARERGIGQVQVIAVRGPRADARLLGLDPGRTVIVNLTGEQPAGELAERLDALIAAGAAVRTAAWRPGMQADPDAGRPRLGLRTGR